MASPTASEPGIAGDAPAAAAPDRGAGDPPAADARRPRGHKRRIAGGLCVAAAVAAIVAAGTVPLDPALREQEHIIPKGTWARRMAGEKLDILPPEIRLGLEVKDVLILRNHDDVPQLFGPVLMMPGQNFRMPFTVASTYQFACTAHVNGFLTVIVEPAPGFWRLFAARVAARFTAIVSSPGARP